MLEEIGEREIIKILFEKYEKMPKMPIPFGDDVSAIEIDEERLGILKTDMLVAKTDVPKEMKIWQAARKAVVMNVSDFAAKGVKPKVMLVSLGLPRKLSKKDIIEEIGYGLNVAAREYDIYIVGGDTNEACDLIIACMLFGIAEKNKVLTRSGAKPGDYVAVTGLFGNPPAGLKILVENIAVDEDLKNRLVSSVLMPKARLKEGLALVKTGAVTASIDSSDGLAWSLHEISAASKVGFEINTVPISSEAKKFAEMQNLDPFELCFYGGEEYELVLTVNPHLWLEAERAVAKLGGQLIKIGKVIEEKGIFLRMKNGKTVYLEPRGWEHFKSP